MKKSKHFETTYQLDLAMYREFARGFHTAKKNYRMFLIILPMIDLLNLLVGNYQVVVFFSIFLLLYLFFLRLLIRNKMGYYRTLESHGGKEIHNKITITDEGIIGENLDGGNKTTYQFEQVIGVVETENLIILQLKYNLGIILSKEKLQGGTKEELFAHLKEVCSRWKKKKVFHAKNSFWIGTQLLFGGFVAIMLVLGILFE